VSRVLLIFLDGVGIGRPDAGINPLAGAPILGNCLPDGWSPPIDGGRPGSLPAPVRRGPVPFGGRVRAVDASLGVPGLPQSATGQTTLFTGVNAAQLLGHHHYGFPGPRLRTALLEHSILKRAVQAGHTAAFLNAYRPLFFELGEGVWSRPMSASSWNNRAAGLPFRTFDDLRAGQALYHDFTNGDAIRRGFDLPRRAPAEAGETLARLAATRELTIYEFFLTDQVGHTRNLAGACTLIADLEAFLASTLSAIDSDCQHVVLTSDHGNVEDLSTKSHTHNPVPAMAWGPRADRLIGRLNRLEDVAAALLDELGETGS
jgi:2,3-bisphosphoglycerate-independent phosphoglycerate mutase